MTVQQLQRRGGGGYLERPAPSGLADVIEIILDKGIVIDAYVRVSLVGIELLTIDARIVIASVDTYLRFAEATNRLDLSSRRRQGPRRVHRRHAGERRRQEGRRRGQGRQEGHHRAQRRRRRGADARPRSRRSRAAGPRRRDGRPVTRDRRTSTPSVACFVYGVVACRDGAGPGRT